MPARKSPRKQPKQSDAKRILKHIADTTDVKPRMQVCPYCNATWNDLVQDHKLRECWGNLLAMLNEIRENLPRRIDIDSDAIPQGYKIGYPSE